MLRVYIAGASLEVDRAEAMIAALRMSGKVEITYDWTRDVRGPDGKIAQAAMNDHAAREYAGADLEGVRKAHVVVVLPPHPPIGTAGMWLEFGVALSTPGVRTIVAGPHARVSIFTRLADLVVERDEDAIAALIGAAPVRACA
jgi:hypothetical protein